MSRKSEIRAVAEHDPWRIDEIRELEEKVTKVMVEKLAADGETLESKGWSPPGYFQAREGRGGQCWPIDKVVLWAKTAHGGAQFELFHTATPGCQMWGLCDMGDNLKKDE